MIDPIIERITQNIVTTLKGVTREQGYSNDLTVERPCRLGNPPRDCLAVVEEIDPSLNESTPQGHISWMQPYIISCFVIEKEGSAVPTKQRVNSLRADVEKAVRVDHTRGGLAVDTDIGEPELFVSDSGAFDGVDVRIEVNYRTLEDDPYTQ